jgi:hypothetical protein
MVVIAFGDVKPHEVGSVIQIVQALRAKAFSVEAADVESEPPKSLPAPAGEAPAPAGGVPGASEGGPRSEARPVNVHVNVVNNHGTGGAVGNADCGARNGECGSENDPQIGAESRRLGDASRGGVEARGREGTDRADSADGHEVRIEKALAGIGEKIDAVAQQKRELAQESARRQGMIEEMATGADGFLAGLQEKLNEGERALFFMLLVRVTAGAVKRFLTYAEIGERLGKVTKQAIERRVRALFDQHRGVEDYVRAVRNPDKAVAFSELSPSERRRLGIEESYGHEPG